MLLFTMLKRRKTECLINIFMIRHMRNMHIKTNRARCIFLPQCFESDKWKRYGDLVCALNRIIGYLNILARLLICLQFKFPTNRINSSIHAEKRTNYLKTHISIISIKRNGREKRKHQRPLRLCVLVPFRNVWLYGFYYLIPLLARYCATIISNNVSQWKNDIKTSQHTYE